jgi:hypothetical protein
MISTKNSSRELTAINTKEMKMKLISDAALKAKPVSFFSDAKMALNSKYDL